MKIGFLITYFYPKIGGAENNCYYLAKELAKKHEVHVFCSGTEDKDEIIKGINVHRSKELFRFKYYFAWYPSMFNSIMRFDLDVLHVHGLGFIQHDFIIRHLKKTRPELKVVVTPHGPFMALKKYNPLAYFIKVLYLPTIRSSLRLYNRVIQVNPSQKKWMMLDYHIPPRKIRLIPNGIPLDALVKPSKSIVDDLISKYNLKGKIVISYLGRIQKYKGIDQIIYILPNLIKKYPSIVFVAMGRDSGDKSRLENLAKKLSVNNQVVFTGEVSEETKKGLLHISDISVLPSEWEAFGIGLLEAMAQGNAIISSSTEGGRYLVTPGKNGFLFEYDNIGKLSKIVDSLLSNPKAMSTMQKENEVKSTRFLWPQIAKDLEKLYLEIV